MKIHHFSRDAVSCQPNVCLTNRILKKKIISVGFCGDPVVVQRVAQRRLVAAMTFLALVSVSTMNGCLSLTITQMVAPIAINTSREHYGLLDMTCPMPTQNVINSSLHQSTIVSIQLSIAKQWLPTMNAYFLRLSLWMLNEWPIGSCLLHDRWQRRIYCVV